MCTCRRQDRLHGSCLLDINQIKQMQKTEQMKDRIKSITPNGLLRLKQLIGRKIVDAEFSGLNISEIFTKVYEEKYWIDNGSGLKYSSGTGSSEKIAEDYCQTVSNFIKTNNIQSVVDLGCGDFQVSKRIIDACDGIDYTGYDCVQQLIDFNRENFSSEKVKFLFANIIEDEFVNAELCLIRQVLQHLSNEQILSIIKKIKKYKYVIITEHYPLDKRFKPNIDHKPGPRTRLSYNSAVVLDRAPFNLKNLTEILTIKDEKHILGYIKTFLLVN